MRNLHIAFLALTAGFRKSAKKNWKYWERCNWWFSGEKLLIRLRIGIYWRILKVFSFLCLVYRWAGLRHSPKYFAARTLRIDYTILHCHKFIIWSFIDCKITEQPSVYQNPLRWTSSTTRKYSFICNFQHKAHLNFTQTSQSTWSLECQLIWWLYRRETQLIWYLSSWSMNLRCFGYDLLFSTWSKLLRASLPSTRAETKTLLPNLLCKVDPSGLRLALFRSHISIRDNWSSWWNS
jgi:hypothetical protein